MGKYINNIGDSKLPVDFAGKCCILHYHGAKEIKQPSQYIDNLVCVVNNHWMAAAAYCSSQRDFNDFTDPSDKRPKRWFTLEDAEKYAK